MQVESTDGDDATLEDVIPDDVTPDDLVDSQERVIQTRNQLSDNALKVFDALIYGNDRMTVSVLVSVARANHIRKNPIALIQPWHIADALFLDNVEVKEAIREIKKVYTEVLNGE
jgi:hypothetical protein